MWTLISKHTHKFKQQLSAYITVCVCPHCRSLQCRSKKTTAKTPSTSARWAQLFTGQEMSMASAGCLHMAQCRRSSLQYLICQQRTSMLVTEILSRCISANVVSHPCSSLRVARFRLPRSILLLTCMLCWHGANTGGQSLLRADLFVHNIVYSTERCFCVSNGWVSLLRCFWESV